MTTTTELHQEELELIDPTATDGPGPAVAPDGARLRTKELALAYVLAGHAIFTLVSLRTQERKTFKVVRARKEQADGVEPGWFVRLLTGADNTADYRYLCFVWKTRYGNLGAKLNRHGWGKEAWRAFEWLLQAGLQSDAAFAQCEVWHTGRCGRCGRLLTVPASVASGLGPVCAGRGS